MNSGEMETSQYILHNRMFQAAPSWFSSRAQSEGRTRPAVVLMFWGKAGDGNISCSEPFRNAGIYCCQTSICDSLSECACGKMTLKWDISLCFVLYDKFFMFFLVLMVLWKKSCANNPVICLAHKPVRWSWLLTMCDWADRCTIIRKHLSLPKLLI